jgi:cell division protein FtsB
MNVKDLLSLKYVNKFTVAIAIFVFWVLFIDNNSWLFHRKLDKEIQKYEERKKFYKEEIIKQKQELKDLKDEKKLEKYAREKLLMKKKGEDLYIIEKKAE